ncbi:hypothetical protein FRC03_012827 [Tulasnella sp. 419]|nr:hypothetical protein FRC03_012827 [Tulasnella sp. 419]
MSSETPQAGHDQHSLSPNTSASSWLNHGVNENPFLLTRGIYGPPPLPQLLELPRAFYEEPAKLEAHEHAPTKRANIAPIGGGTDDTASKGLNGARSDHAEPIHSDSDMENQLFRDFHGREFNTSNAIYHLPADMEEHERLNIQNRIICLLLGNLYPAENIVEGILKRRDGYTPMILDVGTGSGAWAIDMAIKFPHCKVLGLDLVPPKIGHREIPSNCSFAIQDVNFPLTQFQDTFDLVNCRAVEAGYLPCSDTRLEILHLQYSPNYETRRIVVSGHWEFAVLGRELGALSSDN